MGRGSWASPRPSSSPPLNGLRDRIVVQTDGQMKTGRAVVIAALLGSKTNLNQSARQQHAHAAVHQVAREGRDSQAVLTDPGLFPMRARTFVVRARFRITRPMEVRVHDLPEILDGRVKTLHPKVHGWSRPT